MQLPLLIFVEFTFVLVGLGIPLFGPEGVGMDGAAETEVFWRFLIT